jgi:predicted lipoprotein with Yx(FWY)xxD motif
MKTTILVIFMLVVVSMALGAGCTQQQQQLSPTPQPTAAPAPPADTIRTTGSSLGTLYYFANDIPASGASSCYGKCAVAWPVFSADTVRVSSPLDPADFGSITRTDGAKQTTYYGWPLYYYQADTKPGDLNGENVLKTWFVLKPDESVLIAHTPELGLYLTDTSGKTLYYFTKDTTGASTCTGTCLVKWPAFSAAPVTAPSVLKPADFSTVSRVDGVKQTAFMGRPLYYYADDARPGDVKGQGFNTVWYVANVSGMTPVVTTIPTTTPITLSPSSSNYGSSGY